LFNEIIIFTHLKKQNNTYWIVKKTIFTTLSVVLVFLFGCDRDPDFNIIPEIEFESIVFETTTEDIPGGGGTSFRDQFAIFINFQDGDGDLGFTQDDLTDPKFEPLLDTTFFDIDNDGIDDTTTSIRNFNATLFRKVSGEYEIVESNIVLGGSFQPLIDIEQPGPIEGVLRHNVIINNRASFFANTTVEPNDTVRFDVFIIDRELNQSNTITTSDVVVPPVTN